MHFHGKFRFFHLSIFGPFTYPSVKVVGTAGKVLHPWTDKFVKERMLRQASETQVQDALALFRSAGWR